jgi:hypothetical protein
MNKTLTFIAYSALALVLTNKSAAEESQYNKVERIQVQGQGVGNAANYHFYNANGWGAPGCPNAVYAYLSADDSGAKEIFSLAIAAKAQGSTVKFLGACKENTSNYFNVYYIYYN